MTICRPNVDIGASTDAWDDNPCRAPTCGPKLPTGIPPMRQITANESKDWARQHQSRRLARMLAAADQCGPAIAGPAAVGVDVGSTVRGWHASLQLTI